MQCELSKEELLHLDMVLIGELCDMKLLLQNGGGADKLPVVIALLDGIHLKLYRWIEQIYDEEE